ncbi:MAG: PPC domain-containing protein [Actinobacteria bacterium]|nr:PPC domain-containing protein [Actinomycetota bacterium]
MTGSKKPGTATSTWSGSIAYPGADLAASVGATDTHTLTVKAPGTKKKAKKYFEKYSAVLDVTIAWSGVYNDLDLRVLDADGNELAVDGQFATESESVSVPLPGAGTYVVEVTSYLAEPGVSYDATATVTTSK